MSTYRNKRNILLSPEKKYSQTFATPFHIKAHSMIKNRNTNDSEETKILYFMPPINERQLSLSLTPNNNFIKSCKTFSSIKTAPTIKQTKHIKMKTSDHIEQFFNSKKVAFFKNHVHIIDNRLNLMYSEGNEQFLKKLKKKDPEKALLNENALVNVNTKIDYLKKRICFMKKIVDYSYPHLVLAKNQKEKKNRIKIKHAKIRDYKDADQRIKDLEDQQSRFIMKSIHFEKV